MNDVKSAQRRVKELEAALKAKRGSSSRLPQQRTRLAGHDSELELYTEKSIDAVSDALGSLSIGHDSRAKYHGESASSEVSTSCHHDSREPLEMKLTEARYDRNECSFYFLL